MKRQLALSLLCAALFGLSFPPLPLGFLAYGAIVPFLLLLDPLTPREGFRWGYFTGLFICLATIYWIYKPTLPGAIAAILFHPIYLAGFGWGYTFLRRRLGHTAVFLMPILWTAMEYVRSLSEIGFPWISLGNTQSYYVHLIQYAEYTGVFGVSFWVAVLNVCLYEIIQNRRQLKTAAAYAGAMAALLIVPYLHGRSVIPDEVQPEVRVGVVQGNIDPYEKWDRTMRDQNFATYERLTLQLGYRNVDFILWPETALPTYLLHDADGLLRVRRLSKALDTPILTGTVDYIRLAPRKYRTFNSVVLIDAGTGPYPKYDKLHLVPFGERVPWEDDIPLFRDLLQKLEMGEGNFSPGTDIKLFQVPLRRESDSLATNGKFVRVGAVICFESIFPDLVAKFVRRGAQLLVVVTNDGWFGRTGAPYQHAQMAVFRAIENRIAIARSANTGVSMTIDPYGRVRKQTPIFREAVFRDELPLRTRTTFFTRYGDVFSRSVLALTIWIVAATWFASRRRNRRG